MSVNLSKGTSVVLLLAISIPVYAADSNAAPGAAYREAHEKWKAALVQDLKENWLPLAGLFWLKPGINTFGSDPANGVVIAKAPAYSGEFDLNNGTVTAKISPGTPATVAGKSVTQSEMLPDDKDNPTVVEIGSLRMHVIKRGERIGIRVKDVDSSAVQNYRGPAFFPLNLDYRITATFVPAADKKMVDVPNVLGDVTPTAIAGDAHFKINGQDVTLSDLGGDPAKGLFFVFNDQTSKTETYPGGRFLTTDPVENGTVVLDFNRAHNPPCAVTIYATCPLAPRENRLAIAIPAGEKYYHKNAHH